MPVLYLFLIFLSFVFFRVFRLFQSVVESDSEDDVDSFVRKTMHPSCPAESTLFKKRRRYITWNSKPAIMVADLLKSKAVALKSREEFNMLERDEERWAECFEISRHKLNSSLTSCQDKNNRLRSEAKHLYELVLQECGPGLSVRKRRASQMRDILEELDDRQMQLETSIEEYEGIALAASANGVSRSENEASHEDLAEYVPVVHPIVHMTLDELDYPYDVVHYSNMSNGDSSKRNERNATAQDDTNGQTVKSSQVQIKERKERARNNKKRSASNDDDKIDLNEQDEEEDSDGTGFEANGRSGSVTEFCAMFAAVDGTVRLGEASLADLDPFFSDDEGEDGPAVAAVPFKGTSKSASGSAGAKATSATLKALTASQKAATLKAASTWDSSAEYQRECKLAEAFTMPKEKVKENGEIHWAQCVADASQCADLVRSSASKNQLVVPRTRLARGAGSSAVNLSAFAISRTPRGVPLIISPLSQYEDRYLGAVCGSLKDPSTSESSSSRSMTATPPPADPSPIAASKGSAEKKAIISAPSSASASRDEALRLEKQDAVAVHVSVHLPSSLIAAEDAALERCRLQSLAAAAENKIKRLRASNIEWCRQAVETGQSLTRSNGLFSQAQRDDLTEYKIIRRELLTYGIVTAKDTDPPLSPVGEYAPIVPHHVVGKGRGGGGPVNRKGVRSIRGLNFAAANAAMLGPSPTFPVEGVKGVACETANRAMLFSGSQLEPQWSYPIDPVSDPNLITFVDPNVTEEYVTYAEDGEEDDVDGDITGGQELLIGSKGKGKKGGKGGKGTVRTKVDEDGEMSESPIPEDSEDLGFLDSQSQGNNDSPMNSGAARKRGAGGKPVPMGALTNEAPVPANKRRGNASASSSAPNRRR